MIYCSWAGRMPCPEKYKFYHRSLIYRKKFARPKFYHRSLIYRKKFACPIFFVFGSNITARTFCHPRQIPLHFRYFRAFHIRTHSAAVYQFQERLRSIRRPHHMPLFKRNTQSYSCSFSIKPRVRFWFKLTECTRLTFS